MTPRTIAGHKRVSTRPLALLGLIQRLAGSLRTHHRSRLP
jgi:hypothetical protein